MECVPYRKDFAFHSILQTLSYVCDFDYAEQVWFIYDKHIPLNTKFRCEPTQSTYNICGSYANRTIYKYRFRGDMHDIFWITHALPIFAYVYRVTGFDCIWIARMWIYRTAFDVYSTDWKYVGWSWSTMMGVNVFLVCQKGSEKHA